MAFGNLGSSANQILIKIAGDSKGLNTALANSDKDLSSFASKAKAYGPMIGAAFAAAAVGMVAMSVKWAAAEEVVTRQTSALLKAQGIAWGSVSVELDAYMKKLEKLTAYNDTDLQKAFNAMIAAGMTYTDAMKSMNTVTSMAFSLNRDLEGMALLVGKAYNGQTGELSRYGIVLDESLSKTEKFSGLQEYVNTNFADASERSGTLEGQMANLNNQIHNMGEALGAELLPELTTFIGLLAQGGDASFGSWVGRGLADGLRAAGVAFEGISGMGKEFRASRETVAITKDKGKLTVGDPESQKAIIEYYGLRADRLGDISDHEFEIMRIVLETYGFSEKAAQLDAARNYALSDTLALMNSTVTLEELRAKAAGKTTDELNKQTDALKAQEALYKSQDFRGQAAGKRAEANLGAAVREGPGGTTIYSAAAWAASKANKSGV